MACTLTQGFTPKQCKNTSGTASIMIAEFDNVGTITVSNGIATAISMDSGKQFFEYKQKAEVANWKSTPTIDAKSGAYKYEHAITCDLNDLTASVVVESENLIKNTLMCIAKDNDGTYWLFGKDFGMDVTALPWDGGVEMSAFKGGKLEIKGMSAFAPIQVNAGLIAGLLLPASP
jgi:hypothetical protein